jgi:hypothetical protein
MDDRNRRSINTVVQNFRYTVNKIISKFYSKIVLITDYTDVRHFKNTSGKIQCILSDCPVNQHTDARKLLH